jgi:hypothetical protein
VLAAACGNDSDDSPAAGGSKAGAGGSKAGATGSNAGAGTGGTAGAGMGGTVGAGRGGAGNAGVPAASGGVSAGSGGAGASGGLCASEVAPHPVGTGCAVVPTASGMRDTLMSRCSSADDRAACVNLHCGEPWSAFDANGCFRTTCHASSECASDERCVAPVLLGQLNCVASGYTDLSLGSDCTCNFGDTGDCSDTGYCLAGVEHPLASDCDLTGQSCAELAVWASTLELFGLPGSGTDLQEALVLCRDKVERAIAACSGDGGASGEGGASGMTGGAGAGAGVGP